MFKNVAVNAFLSYKWEVPGGLLTASTNLSYSGKYANDPFGTFPGADYTLWNAGLRYGAASGKWWMNLYGRNLNNETYVSSSLFTDSIGEVRFFAPPRTLGLQLGLSH